MRGLEYCIADRGLLDRSPSTFSNCFSSLQLRIKHDSGSFTNRQQIIGTEVVPLVMTSNPEAHEIGDGALSTTLMRDLQICKYLIDEQRLC